MALLTDYACIDALAIATALVIVIVTYFKWSFKYWERAGLPSLPASIPFGTLPSPFASEKVPVGKRLQDIYMEAKRNGYKHVGYYAASNPIYNPIDTGYLRNMLTKDFHHFSDRDIYHNEKDDPLSAHLFSLKGQKWKNLRAKLTPTFTTGKMKMMFRTVVECGTQLKEAVDEMCDKGGPIEIKDVVSRFTIDVIGSCAFGLDCNSFKQPESDFRKYGSKTFRFTALQTLKNMVTFTLPNLSRKLGLMLTPRDVSDFFLNVIKETVEYREKNNVKRNDFLQLLIHLKNDVKIDEEDGEAYKHDGKSLTFDELAAQAFVFFVAGFDTSSLTMTYTLFELAQNQDIQDRVRNEIRTVLEKNDGKLTYENLAEMKYLGQVLEESLRKHPPIVVLFRLCVKDYPVPETSVVVEKGTSVMVSILGLHRDPDHFPDPEKFDPDRFSPENRGKIDPFAYIPFGDGPRNCIGLRFALMTSKVGLVTLLKNYRFSLNPETKLPLEIEPFSFAAAIVNDILLDVERVEEP